MKVERRQHEERNEGIVEMREEGRQERQLGGREIGKENRGL